MIARLILILILAPAAAAMAQAGAVCPWFTAGSAAKVLGGDVSLTAHLTAQPNGSWEGDCRFVRGSGASAPAIAILIGEVDTHPCPPASAKLKALGNEAMQCHQTIQGEQADTIAGRMRDLYFVVTMIDVPEATRDKPADARLASPYGASALERVAEQVVGNLY